LTSGSVHAKVLSWAHMSTDFGADSWECGQRYRRDWTPYRTPAAVQLAWLNSVPRVVVINLECKFTILKCSTLYMALLCFQLEDFERLYW